MVFTEKTPVYCGFCPHASMSIGTGNVKPENIQQTRTLEAQGSDLLRNSSNRLVVERGAGEGALYYSADLNLELPADRVRPVSRGIAVEREYFLNDYPYRTVFRARVGDIITVRLSLTLPQDIYYFVLDDALPAGTER